MFITGMLATGHRLEPADDRRGAVPHEGRPRASRSAPRQRTLRRIDAQCRDVEDGARTGWKEETCGVRRRRRSGSSARASSAARCSRIFEAEGRDVRVYDPPKGLRVDRRDRRRRRRLRLRADAVHAGRGFDDSFLLDAVARVRGPKTVVIKSTVLPGTTELLQERYPQHRFMFNPEFLREATAYDDFVNPDRQIVGYTAASAGEAHAGDARCCRARRSSASAPPARPRWPSTPPTPSWR